MMTSPPWFCRGCRTILGPLQAVMLRGPKRMFSPQPNRSRACRSRDRSRYTRRWSLLVKDRSRGVKLPSSKASALAKAGGNWGKDRARSQRQLGHVPIALGGAGHALAIPGNSSIADITGPRVDDVCGGIHLFGIAGTQRDLVASLQILGSRVLVPGQRGAGHEDSRCERHGSETGESHDAIL